jgi:hypothetical protein
VRRWDSLRFASLHPIHGERKIKFERLSPDGSKKAAEEEILRSKSQCKVVVAAFGGREITATKKQAFVVDIDNRAPPGGGGTRDAGVERSALLARGSQELNDRGSIADPLSVQAGNLLLG